MLLFQIALLLIVPIIKAKKPDASILTELTIRSKSYWEYGQEQIEAWRPELTITEKYISENQVYKLVIDNLLIGFYAYQAETKTDIKLNFLFVDPKFIGKGYGKILMTDFLKRIKKSGFVKVTLDADPNAKKFYIAFGFHVIGKLKTAIPNRFLPIMELKL